MIIVRLTGGLGNQLFQYAAGRTLSICTRRKLGLDLSYYAQDSTRRFGLDYFNTRARIIPRWITTFLTGRGGAGPLARASRVAHAVIPALAHTLIEAKSFAYDHEALRHNGSVYLCGWWQSEKYFKAIEPELRRELRVKPSMTDAEREWAEEMLRQNSVSVHLRRGDYVTDLYAQNLLGPLPMEYYQRATQAVCDRVKAPCFFVFSDDIEWGKRNLTADAPIRFVSMRGQQPDYVDLRLMTYCRHHIIANSTYSWWGAWLATYPKKWVIAPKTWFKDPAWDARDIVPESWERL